MYTDEKENKMSLLYKETQNGAVASKVIYEEGLPIIFEEMRK
jgi:hypothetical protein